MRSIDDILRDAEDALKKLSKHQVPVNEDGEGSSGGDGGESTASTSDNVGAYNTPYAFGNYNMRHVPGYSVVKKKKKSKFTESEIPTGSPVNESRYLDYKKDPRPAYKKINETIHEVNKSLKLIETMMSHSSKLKTESNVTTDMYWKKTKSNINKITERINRIQNKLLELIS